MSAADLDPDFVPELLITELRDSLDFRCTLCGFTTLYDRAEEGFAYVEQGSACPSCSCSATASSPPERGCPAQVAGCVS
jgi:hypothetical protein